MGNRRTLEVPAIMLLPLAEERRRREAFLASLMLLMTDTSSPANALGLETARDLIRKVRHCYPELVDDSS